MQETPLGFPAHTLPYRRVRSSVLLKKYEGDAHSVHHPRCITTLYYTKTPQPGTPALSRLRR